MGSRKGLTEFEREIVTTLVDSKSVDFGAIGAAFAKVGPGAAFQLDGEDVFCGTMRRFIRVFRLRDSMVELEGLAELRQVSEELHR